MLISKQVVIKWNSSNKKRYEYLGYVYTKMNDEFLVNTEHLSIGSHADVAIKCDYCGEEFTKMYKAYLKQREDSPNKKDCCINCIGHKSNETFYNEHGYYVGKDSIQKSLKTIKQKYGVDNIVHIEGVVDKIKANNKSKIGELNSNWRGGITPINAKLRKSDEYESWRKQVFERDNYTCQCCGKKYTFLHCHHLYSFIDNENLRTNIDNGVTLCKECHNKFHSIYGKRGNNTKEQFIDFITNIKEGLTTIENT